MRARGRRAALLQQQQQEDETANEKHDDRGPGHARRALRPVRHRRLDTDTGGAGDTWNEGLHDEDEGVLLPGVNDEGLDAQNPTVAPEGALPED